jgi:hypothetical protein
MKIVKIFKIFFGCIGFLTMLYLISVVGVVLLYGAALVDYSATPELISEGSILRGVAKNPEQVVIAICLLPLVKFFNIDTLL